MSSLVRRIEKQLMKRAGYTRELWIMVNNIRGELVPQQVRRGGEITDPDDNPIGRTWPRWLPDRARAPTRTQQIKWKKARGSRRGKPSKRWIERRRARAA